MELNDIIKSAARQCEIDGVALDDSPCGPIHQWATRNIAMRPGTEFFVVFLIAYEMGKAARIANKP